MSENKLSIRLISDLHVESNYSKSIYGIREYIDKLLDTYRTIQREKPADVLIIAGDIAPVDVTRHPSVDYGTIDPAEPLVSAWVYLIRGLREIYGSNNVIYIAGNHDYYYTFDSYHFYNISGDGINHRSMETCDEFMRDFCRVAEIIYLNNGEFTVIRGVKIIGAVGWTNDSFAGMHDFKLIGVQEGNRRRVFSHEDVLRIHQQHLDGINNALHTETNVRKTIVVTHHAPIEDLCSYKAKTHGDLAPKSYCSSDVLPIIQQNKIDYWLYGHTHDGYLQTIMPNLPNTVFITNAFGRGEEHYIANDRRQPFNPRHYLEV